MLESPPLNTIGEYIGAYFLEVENTDAKVYDRNRSFLSTLHTKPIGYENVSFSPVKYVDTTFTTPIVVALYKLSDQTVHIQAIGRNRWLNKSHGLLQWSTTPINVGWHEADGKVTLSVQDGGTRFEACRRRTFPELDYYFSPSWEPTPHELPTLKLLKTEKHPLAKEVKHLEKMGPFPSPEVMRRGADYTAFNFEDIFLLGIDLSRTKLPKAVFSKATLRDVNFKEAHLVEAQFQGCVFTRAGDAAICKFNGADLRDARFDKAVADRCHFAWATLHRANFAGASLAGVDFTGADLSGADFTGANLTGAILKGATLTGTIFTGSDLTRTDFTGTNLTKAKLAGVVMPYTVLTGANLTGNDLSGCDLRTATAAAGQLPTLGRSRETRTNFTNAKLNFLLIGLNWSFLNLEKASFVNLPMNAANRQNLSGLNAESAILTEMRLNNFILDGADFQNAVLRGVNLTAASLDTAKLMSANLKGAQLTQASMMNTNLSGADLTNANLTEVELWGENATVANATMVLTSFTNAYLAGVDFSGFGDKAFQGCKFDRACLVNTKFKGSHINAFDKDLFASFVGACLQGANFEGATLFGANLTNAAIATEAGTLRVRVRSLGTTLELSYDEPTIIDTEMTGGSTVCPSGDSGPCTVEQFTSDSAPMDAWPATQPPATPDLAESTANELPDQE